MYICAEQKATALFEGREIRITERAANAHYRMCNMPITDIEVDVYLNVTLQEDVAKLPRFTDEFLTWMIDVNVMDELESLDLEWLWELPNERTVSCLTIVELRINLNLRNCTRTRFDLILKPVLTL